MKNRLLYIPLIGLTMLFVACDKEPPVQSVVQINEELHIPIYRFDQRIVEIDTNNLDADLAVLEADMPEFTDLYFKQILGDNSVPHEKIILDILTDSGYLKLNRIVQESFDAEDLGSLNSEIAQGLRNYLRVFDLPVSATPSIYTFISGFIYQSLVFNDEGKEGVALGLEMFLGDDFPYKLTFLDNPMFSDYLTRTYNIQHLSKRLIEVLVEDKMPPPAKGDFLSLMIWGGKKLYIMDKILDFKSDTIVLEYSDSQLEWCRQNEAEMWDYFFDKDLFYKTDMRSFSKLIGPAPSSPGMPPESPGGTGNYMGLQVVKSYMDRHPEMSIMQLLEINDAQQILD
ncbi:MAG: hypothetical protein ACI9FN_000647, partial [Saprospiraceae bacterium]